MCKLGGQGREAGRPREGVSDADSSDRHRGPARRASPRAPRSVLTASSGAEVEIGARTRLMANLYLEGPTWIGEDNLFFPYSTVGVASQDLKYKGERAETRIGHRNRIREFVTIHRGTAGRRPGDLASAATTCSWPTRTWRTTSASATTCILGNSVALAGPRDDRGLGRRQPFSGVHQFCRIGRHAFIGPYSVVTQDVLPYSLTSHERASRRSSAPTAIGLERRGFDKPVDRSAADGVPAADARRAQHLAGHRAHPRRGAAVRRGGRADRVHPLVRARRSSSDALRADRRQRPVPGAGARKRAAAGPRRHGDRHRGGSVAAKSRRWRRAATGSRSAS